MADQKISAMPKTALVGTDIIPKTPAAGGENDSTTPADLQAFILKVPVSIVSALPAAATAGQGAVRAVSDALTPALGVAVTGGGAVFCLVLSTGAAWVAC